MAGLNAVMKQKNPFLAPAGTQTPALHIISYHIINVFLHAWMGENIKTYLKETEFEDVDWTYLAQDMEKWWTLVNTTMNLWVPLKARKS